MKKKKLPSLCLKKSNLNCPPSLKKNLAPMQQSPLKTSEKGKKKKSTMANMQTEELRQVEDVSTSIQESNTILKKEW